MAAGSSRKSEFKYFEKFLGRRKILIADRSGSARSVLSGILTRMGSPGTQILMAEDYPSAEKVIESAGPCIVIAEYDLALGSGLELFQKQRKQNPFMKESVFILFGDNLDQKSAARGAEEDVDVFVLRPFTAEAFQAALQKGILMKSEPTEYYSVVERGKFDLQEGRLDAALKQFHTAKSKDPIPALACYYLGQTYEAKGSLEEAEGSYLQGLEYNEMHYSCLLGMYELLMKQKRLADAFIFMKKLLNSYPATPQRLMSGLRLAVVTQKFDELEGLYNIFTRCDTRDNELSRVMSMSLVAAGRNLLQRRAVERGLFFLQKAAISSKGNSKVLRDIIVALVDMGFGDKGEEFLKRFEPEARTESDYLAANFLLLDQVSSNSITIEKGRELLAKGCSDPVIYSLMIKRSQEAGLTHAAEELKREADKKYPNDKALFEKAFAATRK